jgi:DNA-binding transcriptional regulator LsrR (DeoR family)
MKKEKGSNATPENHNKDNHFASQYKTVYQLLKERPKTMLEVSIETGILRANICRYVSEMEEKGQIQVNRKGYCPYTHFTAGFYSTDEALFTKLNAQQLNLFDNGGI